MDGIQSKMARAAFGWSTHDLARKANVGRVTVARFESGETISEDSLAKIESALAGAGAAFTKKTGRVGVSVPG